MLVIKRNGQEVPFNKNKIIEAINKAFIEVDKELYETDTAESIADIIENYNKTLNVEEIQDIVEEYLMASERRDVAKAYIRYRYKKEVARKTENDFMEAIADKLMAKNVINQNANVDEYSFGGRVGEATNVMMERYALDHCMSKQSRDNHLNNRIYIHDLSSYAVGSHNCFERKTKFITSDGVKSFEDFNDGDSVIVLSPDATWRTAIVRNYGIQKVREYKIKRNRTEVIIKATENHRWINKNGEFQEGLKLHDKLLDSPYFWEDFDFDGLSEEGKNYWYFGFVKGDGSGIQYDKTIPNFDVLPLEWLIAYIHGLYDANGTHCTDASTLEPIYSIQFSDKELCDFVEKYFPIAGLYINSIVDKTGQKTNFEVRGYTKTYQFTGQPSTKFNWYVSEIGDTLEEMPVWCLEVKDTHSFVLESGIPTGNCLSIPFDDLLANGFNTRQTDVRPAGSVSTAFQLVAVIFQLQSLQQFGGVSATHLDWTMVPYVRKSFWKHFKDGCTYVSSCIDGESNWEYYFGEDSNQIDFKKIPIEPYEHHFNITDSSYNNVIEIAKMTKAYDYAIKQTEKEIHQAVEGLFHNLNIWAA